MRPPAREHGRNGRPRQWPSVAFSRKYAQNALYNPMSLSNTQGYLPVAIALGGNALVTVIKGLAAAASRSSAMLSEAVHSFADTLNQLLLLIGLRRSLRKPD